MQFILSFPFWFIMLLGLIPIFWYWIKLSLTHFPAWRNCLILLLRSSAVILLTFALVGPIVQLKNFSRYVVFAIDSSDSVSSQGRILQDEFLRNATKNTGENEYVIMPYARTPGAVNTTLNAASHATLDPSGTNISTALAAAVTLIPEDYVPKVVMLTDNTTLDGGKPLCVATSVPVDLLTVPQFTGPETWIERAVFPALGSVGHAANIDVFIRSTLPGKCSVTLKPFSVNSSSNPTASAPLPDPLHPANPEHGAITLKRTIIFSAPGIKGVRFEPTLVKNSLGINAWTVEISPEKDTYTQNNSVKGATRIVPSQEILLVERNENLGIKIRNALAKQFIDVNVCTPENIPTSLSELNRYGLVLISNIPITDLNLRATQLLENYVSSGGGLIVIGGDQSFTSGGYHTTSLEKVLPVECVPTTKKMRDPVALVLVVDRSESMVSGVNAPAEGRLSAMDLAKQAARQAMQILDSQDKVGLLAYGDSAIWVVPLEPLSDKKDAFRKIDLLDAKSVTNMAPALERAYLALKETSAPRKHIILLTDGISNPGDFELTARKIANQGITISTVALGEEAEQNVLHDIALLGHGKSYVCTDPSVIPHIFTHETASAAKIGIVEGSTPIKRGTLIPGFASLNFGSIPPLLGYVQTRLRPDSRVILRTDSGDPILAWWKFGNGTVIAFTSDMESHWVSTWQKGWNDFDLFWARLVNHAIRKNPDRMLCFSSYSGIPWTRIVLESNEKNSPLSVKISNISRMDAGAFRESDPSKKSSPTDPGNKNTENTSSDPFGITLSPTSVPGEKILDEIAPGVFATQLRCEPLTPYQITLDVTRHDGKNMNVSQLKYFIFPLFSSEYRPGGQLDVTEPLRALVKDTSGKIAPSPDSIFNGTDSTRCVNQTLKLWRWIMFMAMICWGGEIFLRRTGQA